MYSSILLSALVAIALASPLAQQATRITGKSATWEPLAGTKTTCDRTTDKILGLNIGPQLETIINNACAAMMPKCAYPDRAGSDTFCIQTIDWPLSEPVTSSLSANMENAQGIKTGGWAVKFDVTPPAHSADSVGAQWTVQDCYGYFSYMLEQSEPNGCRRTEGFGIGNITVGGTPSAIGGENALAGTVFKISIVST